ncbi:MAG: hypothetical protein DRI71_03480 [Bacteroidetes bacterium]|nr:MAG: hypothetical protein DRI71_03480 [Bacteroidota bacterium]
MTWNLFIKLAILFVVMAIAAIYFVYNKPHRDILGEEAKFSLSLTEMNEEFLADEDAAFKKYFNQVVEISGTVISINKKENERYDVVLESNGIIANGELIYADDKTDTIINKKALLKGLFIGYDNLLEEIKLSECSLKQSSTNK